ncbi:hypothetical protein JR316_0008633 [Psilocybe cubensis]|uniref:Uncharacterized protein n=2 Tax=Psilocybe cubensis TaxID=181762 RepID=A0ACB8GR26_PSICU|nr:hypothetical protein JR316_0008633 [Psilocybe cubensis]KAH9478180.1 hypothetical protein JR316_0008633 [Psilocybe cubensis]
MYTDHFDILSFHERREQLQAFEHRKHQMEVELLKADLDAARDRILALETAYEELQIAHEQSLRAHINGHNVLNPSPKSVNEYETDSESGSWEVPPSPWIGDSPLSSASIPSFIQSTSPVIHELSCISSSPTPSSALSEDSSYDIEEEVPALANASQEDALRYAELLEQCDYDVRSANAVWKEWEASVRESLADEETAGDFLGDTDSELESDVQDWEWEEEIYEASPLSPESVRDVSLATHSPTFDVERDSITQNRIGLNIPPLSSLPRPNHIDGPPIQPASVESTIYVDASGTGLGFCICIPSQTSTTTNFLSRFNSKTNMMCYWLGWKWVRGNPAIAVGISGQIVMSWAELIGLELGVYTACTMRSQRGGEPSPLIIHSDNMDVVKAISCAVRSKNAPARRWKHAEDAIVRRIISICEAHGVHLVVRWVPSKANLADGPSRGHGVHGAAGWERTRETQASVRGLGGDPTLMIGDRGWMEWVADCLPVPAHLEAFVQDPTGGVVGLRQLKIKGPRVNSGDTRT